MHKESTRNLSHPRYTPISRAQEITLMQTIREGGSGASEARERLLLANTRFLAKVSLKLSGPGISFEDAYGAGFLGMDYAIDKYDPTRCKFISYAIWWIRHYIANAVRSERTIHSPNGNYIRHRQAKASEANEEKAERIGKQLDAIQIASNVVSWESLSQIGIEPIDREPNPCERSESMDRGIVAKYLVGHLPEEQRKIVRMRYGIDGTEMTLHEVADKIGCSKERVRQIQVDALEKMRGLCRVSNLSWEGV